MFHVKHYLIFLAFIVSVSFHPGNVIMLQKTDNEKQFVVDILAALRKEKFGFKAWIRFLGMSWKRSCETARVYPSLKCSWKHITLFISACAMAILIGNFIVEGAIETLRLMPGFIFCVGWQQSDLFWHLGLNRQSRTGTLLPIIGAATTLTVVRGLGACYLLGRISGGISTPSWLALLVFLCGILTDILDGYIARRTQTQTKLGQIADGEADFCLYLAISLILIQNNVLSLWFGLVILSRFAIPLIAALVSYFYFARPVRFGSTNWGKASGFALCIYFLVLLISEQSGFFNGFVHVSLSIVTLTLLLIAPIAQITRNVMDTNFS